MLTAMIMFFLNNATYAGSQDYFLAAILSFVIGIGSLVITYEKAVTPGTLPSRILFTVVVLFLLFQAGERIIQFC